MKQSVFFLSLIMLLTSSCDKSDDLDVKRGYADIEFSAYTVEHTGYDVTKATLDNTISSLDFVVYALNQDGSYSLYRHVEQSKFDADFGRLALEQVAYGSYIVVAVGHNCSVHATFYSPKQVDFDGRVAETFIAYSELIVDDNTERTQNLELNRITSKFVLRALDAQPADVATVEFLITGGATDFDPSTGLAHTTSVTVRTVTIPASQYSGTSVMEYTFHTFLPNGNSVISVVANFKDSDGNILFSHSFSGAEMAVNEQTIYEGSVYSTTRAWNIGINDEWKDKKIVKF